MAKKIIGNTKIELTNVRTGKTETYEKHNMLTGHLSKLLSLNPWGTIKPDSLMPLVGRVMGGIALFPEQKEEDVNNDILFNDFTAYAQVNANGTTDTRRGSFNFTESGPISGGQDGYRMVWDFTTSQGNGTYNCVALTHPYINKDRMAFPPLTDYGPTYGYSAWNISNGTDTEAYNLFYLPQAYDNETGMFYRLAVDTTSSLTVHRGRRPMTKILLGEAPFYGTTSDIAGNPAAVVDGRSALLYDYEKRTITLNKAILGSHYCNSCSYRKENGVPYMYIFSLSTSVSANFQLTKINLDDYTFEEKTLTYSGASFKVYSTQYIPLPEMFPLIGDYLYLPKKDESTNYCREAFYKVNITDESDITEIAIPEEIQTSGANDVFYTNTAGYIMQNDYGYWWIKRRAYSSNNQSTKYTIGLCNDEMLLLDSRSMYNSINLAQSVVSIENTWVGQFNSQNNNDFFYPALNNYYMLSINNLAAPVTKTSEQLMKITYTLTEVEE